MSTGDPNITSPLPMTTSTPLVTQAVTYSTLITRTLLSSTLSNINIISTANATVATQSISTAKGTNVSTTMTPCKTFEYNFDQDIGLSVVCGICFFLGLILAFTGYRMFRLTMFIQTMSLTGVLSYLVLIQRTSLGVLWNGVIAGGIGLGLGVLAALINTIGLIGCSLIQGLFVSVSVLFIVELFIVTLEVVWIPIGVIGGVSVLLTTLCLIWQRPCAILYITSYSAILVMISVDYFLDVFLLTRYAYSKILLVDERQPCWFSWTVFALWPIFMILGSCVQFLKTAKNFNHRKVKGKVNKLKNPRHRRLYDNGDVIAQAWIQTTEDTLEKRRSCTPNFDSYQEDDEEHTTLV